MSILNACSTDIPEVISMLIDKMGNKSSIYTGSPVSLVLDDLEAGMMALANVQINKEGGKDRISDMLIREIDDAKGKEAELDTLIEDMTVKFFVIKIIQALVEKENLRRAKGSYIC
ncbi:hypothetical protein GQ472_01925 [archaeon]|nr:hypothetical protein [archaeon]